MSARARSVSKSLIAMLLLVACDIPEKIPPPEQPPGPDASICDPMVTFFEKAIWQPFLGSTCFGCHGPDGAGARASELRLTPVDPEAAPLERGAQLGVNLAVAERLAAEQVDGQSILVVKASGGADHGGGTILPEGSQNLEMLRAFVLRLANGGECVETPTGPDPDSFADDGDDPCSTPPVTDRFDAQQAVAVPPINTARLTHWQLRALVSLVLGVYQQRLGDWLPSDGSAGPIPNTQDLELSVADYERYQSAAQQIADKIIERDEDQEGALFACERRQNRVCAENYLRRVTRLLFRRDATASERASLLSIFDIGAAGSFYEGMRYMLEALLVYPDTLYHLEFGSVADQERSERRLSRKEIANRLAFFLTARPPDEAMLAAAEAGQFDTDEGVAQWTQELLNHESKARFAIQHFHQRWLNFDDASYIAKDPELHPGFDADTFNSLRNSAVVWAAYVALKGEGTFTSLMRSATTALNSQSPAATYYGIDTQANDAIDQYGSWSIYPLPADERAGLISRPAYLASIWNSDAEAGRPILRGAHLLRDVFCDELVPPVNNFPPPERPEDQTAHDDLAFTVASQPCKSCHEQINPIGLALEQYDAAGRFRSQDRGQPIETTGNYGQSTLCDTERVSFSSGLDMARSLADNPRVQACYTLQWFRYALRRDAQADDAGALGRILQRFKQTNLSIPDLLAGIATSRPFLYRTFQSDGR